MKTDQFSLSLWFGGKSSKGSKGNSGFNPASLNNFDFKVFQYNEQNTDNRIHDHFADNSHQFGNGSTYPGFGPNIGSGGHSGGQSSTPVPEPATLLLLGAGLVGLAGVGRKKLKG